MAPPVWGTFSVRDHCRREAFLREILLFDKLAVPYPDRNVPSEWDRWLHPNADNPAETWDPVRLDLLLGVLGSDEAPGYNGARCAQLVHWSPGVWEAMQIRLGAADAITGDPFMDARLGIVLGSGQAATAGNEAPGTLLYADDLTGRCARPVVLGGPGSGKTWLARRSARLSAQAALRALNDGADVDQVELPLLPCGRHAPGGRAWQQRQAG